MPRTPANSNDLARTEHAWPDPQAGPFKITLRWSEIDGRPECVEVSVKLEQDPARAIPVTVLRQIPLGDFISVDRAALAPPVEATGGMRRSAADRLRVAADVYEAALMAGLKPTKAVAEHFGISSGGASNLVARVRAAGLLPPTSPGKAAGGVASDVTVEQVQAKLDAIRRWAEQGLLDSSQAAELKLRLLDGSRG